MKLQARYKHDPTEGKIEGWNKTVSHIESDLDQVAMQDKSMLQKEEEKKEVKVQPIKSKKFAQTQAKGFSRKPQVNKLTQKFKALIEHNKKEFNFEDIRALYRIQRKELGNKPPVVKFSEIKSQISKPTKPLVKRFYDKHISDTEIIKQGLDKGIMVKGRLYFDQAKKEKNVAYVDCEGIEQKVKVKGLKHLNRAFHMDEVLVKFTNWVDWIKAKETEVANIDFKEHIQYLKEDQKVVKEEDKEEEEEKDEEDEGEEIEENEENEENEEGEGEEGDVGEGEGNEEGDYYYYGDENGYYGYYEYYDEEEEKEEKEEENNDEDGNEEEEEKIEKKKKAENKKGGKKKQTNKQEQKGKKKKKNKKEQTKKKVDKNEKGADGEGENKDEYEYDEEEDEEKEDEEEYYDYEDDDYYDYEEYGKEEEVKEDIEEDIEEEKNEENEEPEYDEEYGDAIEQSIKEMKVEFGETIKFYEQEDFLSDDSDEDEDDLERGEDGDNEEQNQEEQKIDIKAQTAKQTEDKKKIEVNQKKLKGKSQKQVFVAPTIMKPPKIENSEQLKTFMSQDKIKVLRPVAKVVGILSSIKNSDEQTHTGMMKRVRIGPKEKNKWKQLIESLDPSLPHQFMLTDQSIKELKPRKVKFRIAGWKDKWALAELVK